MQVPASRAWRKRSVLTLLVACAGLMVAGNLAVAQGKGPPDAKGQPRTEKLKHDNKSGQAILGAKLKQNGKHAVGMLGARTVSADVQGGKVRDMTAGDLPVKRVRSKSKVASADGVFGPFAPGGGIELAQFGGYDTYYYGFCFADGLYFTCYWYPATFVYYNDYVWDDYSDYYYYYY
jgi:hypothetical protein